MEVPEAAETDVAELILFLMTPRIVSLLFIVVLLMLPMTITFIHCFVLILLILFSCVPLIASCPLLAGMFIDLILLGMTFLFRRSLMRARAMKSAVKV